MLPKTLIELRNYGRTPLTGRDFLALTSANNVCVKITSDCERGMYYCVQGRDYIALSSRISTRERAFVAWHEFAHFLQNFYLRKTIVAFSKIETDSASEKLADVFAAIAVNPNAIRITGPQDFLTMLMTKR